MKKSIFLSIAAAIVVAMTFGSCNNSTKSVKVGGQSYNVDTFVVAHHLESRVEEALLRDNFMQNKVLPTDASSFGEKKAEVCWRAFVEDVQNWNFVQEVGKVTVVHYENGLEIVKDGRSWFYDGFPYEEANLLHISGGLSILHQPRWEPVELDFIGSGLQFKYIYPQNSSSETFYILSQALDNLDINRIGQVLASANAIKRY